MSDSIAMPRHCLGLSNNSAPTPGCSGRLSIALQGERGGEPGTSGFERPQLDPTLEHIIEAFTDLGAPRGVDLVLRHLDVATSETQQARTDDGGTLRGSERE